MLLSTEDAGLERLFREYLQTLPKDEKHVLFFDEMPWLDTPRSGFLPAFEYFWNNWGSAQDNLVCLVCGSATAWLVENIANNKGGLYNRQTCRIYLEPFTLNETEQYLKANGKELCFGMSLSICIQHFLITANNT